MFLVSRTSEVNRNASMLADLLSEMFIPRFGARRLESARVTGIMHYVEVTAATFSRGGPPHYILQRLAWPHQGHKDRLIYLTASAIKLLTPFMSWSNFYIAGSNMKAISFWLKVVLHALCVRVFIFCYVFFSISYFFLLWPMLQQNWIRKSNANLIGKYAHSVDIVSFISPSMCGWSIYMRNTYNNAYIHI